MGLLVSSQIRNRRIISVEQLRYEDYIIDIELVEYDRYERLLWMSRSEPKVGIHVRAFPSDTELTEFNALDNNNERVPQNNPSEAEETLAWPKERGQDDWLMQVEFAVENVIGELADKPAEPTVEDQFAEAIKTYRQEGLPV
jgi:hypothetical protein